MEAGEPRDHEDDEAVADDPGQEDDDVDEDDQDVEILRQRGRRGGMWEKKQKRKWYLFFISPENWRFFVLFPRSVNIDRLRESYKYALVQSLHSPSQFYAEI